MIKKTYKLKKNESTNEYGLSDDQGNTVKLGTKDLEKATKRAKRYMNLLPKMNFQ
tara:strand:+ start:74 stop:238 length:165 start_codon:yes stop_codon:yes gene_type:complete